MPRLLQGAIIGCGFFGRIQMEAWRRMPDVQIVAACDTDFELARQTATRAYSSAESMFAAEALDFVDIATRPEAHLPLTRLAAAHKIPVICQKPMAPSWEDCVAMVQVAEAAGIPLMIHENWRWQPWYRAARDMISRGDIGTPIHYRFLVRRRDGLGSAPYPAQPYFREMRRLLIYETLVHHFDTARFLFGEVARVFAQARRLNPQIAGEDQAHVLLTHASGLLGSIDGHRFLDPRPDGPAMGEAVFEGEQGSLHVLASGDVYSNGSKAWENTRHDGYRGDSVLATQQHFVDCLRTGKAFETSGREYLKTVAVVEAAYRSIAEGCAVQPAPCGLVL